MLFAFLPSFLLKKHFLDFLTFLRFFMVKSKQERNEREIRNIYFNSHQTMVEDMAQKVSSLHKSILNAIAYYVYGKGSKERRKAKNVFSPKTTEKI